MNEHIYITYNIQHITYNHIIIYTYKQNKTKQTNIYTYKQTYTKPNKQYIKHIYIYKGH